MAEGREYLGGGGEGDRAYKRVRCYAPGSMLRKRTFLLNNNVHRDNYGNYKTSGFLVMCIKNVYASELL